MAVRGACHLSSVVPDTSNPGMLIASLTICGTDTTNIVSGLNSELSIDPSASSSALSTSIAAFAQAVLNDYGYVFVVGDTVAVFGL